MQNTQTCVVGVAISKTSGIQQQKQTVNNPDHLKKKMTVSLLW